MSHCVIMCQQFEMQVNLKLTKEKDYTAMKLFFLFINTVCIVHTFHINKFMSPTIAKNFLTTVS